MIHWLRELALDALALLWPTQCVSCGAPDRDCCDGCRDELRAGYGTAIWVVTPVGVPACVAGPYEGPLRAQLVAFKHAGRTGFARELGARLSAPLHAALSLARGPTMPLLVTVPSRATRVRQRGYRHVDILVRAAPLLGAAPRPRLVPRALRALHGRTSQVGLTASERQQNAALVGVSPGAREILRDREVVLIDDVVTTGATAAAAHRALTEVGARVIAVVALCAVERRSGSPLERGSPRASSPPVRHLPEDAPEHNQVENRW